MLEARSVRVRGAVLSGRPVLQRRDGSRRYATAHNVCTCNIHPYTQNIHSSDTISDPEKTAFSFFVPTLLRLRHANHQDTCTYNRSPRLTWLTLDPSLPLLLRSSLPMNKPFAPTRSIPHPRPRPSPSPLHGARAPGSPSRRPNDGVHLRETIHTLRTHTPLSLPPCS